MIIIQAAAYQLAPLTCKAGNPCMCNPQAIFATHLQVHSSQFKVRYILYHNVDTDVDCGVSIYRYTPSLITRYILGQACLGNIVCTVS